MLQEKNAIRPEHTVTNNARVEADVPVPDQLESPTGAVQKSTDALESSAVSKASDTQLAMVRCSCMYFTYCADECANGL